MKYSFKWSWFSNKSEWHDTGWDWESFPYWLFRIICFQFNPTWDRDNCRGWAACSGPGPSCRLQMVQLTAHYADNISLWLSGVNTSPVASAAQSQVTSPDLMRSWGGWGDDVSPRRSLRYKWASATRIFTAGYGATEARVDKYCWHHAQSQRLPCPAGLCQPPPGLAMLRSVRAGSGEARPGPGLGWSRWLSEPACLGVWCGLCSPRLLPCPAVSLGCVYGRGQRPDGTQDAGQPRNGQSPAISRRRPWFRTKLRPRVNNKQININSATLARLPPRRHRWLPVPEFVLGLARWAADQYYWKLANWYIRQMSHSAPGHQRQRWLSGQHLSASRAFTKQISIESFSASKLSKTRKLYKPSWEKQRQSMHVKCLYLGNNLSLGCCVVCSWSLDELDPFWPGFWILGVDTRIAGRGLPWPCPDGKLTGEACHGKLCYDAGS